MITTVTTATMVSMTAASAASLALIAILFLISLLIQRELISGLRGERAQRLRKVLNGAILPLAAVCITTIGFRVVELLG